MHRVRWRSKCANLQRKINVRLPNNKERILIVGATGSGKSVAAAWHLSQKNFDTPWVIFNHKGDEFLRSIPYAAHVRDLSFTPPKKIKNNERLFIYEPVPEVDDDAVTELLWKFHARENIGIYIDEGYMINPRDPALVALYTQGRSKHIPMITLSQRPVGMCSYGRSESEFYQVFRLNDKEDRKSVNRFIPNCPMEDLMTAAPNAPIPLPKFHSIYYDVSANKLEICPPVPDKQIILDMFEQKLKRDTNKKVLL